jgi:hypothetical protein
LTADDADVVDDADSHRHQQRASPDPPRPGHAVEAVQEQKSKPGHLTGLAMNFTGR